MPNEVRFGKKANKFHLLIIWGNGQGIVCRPKKFLIETGVSQGTVENSQMGGMEEEEQRLVGGRMRKDRLGCFSIIFSSEEGGAWLQAWMEGVEGSQLNLLNSSHSVPGGMLTCWPPASSLPPRCWAQLLKEAPAGRSGSGRRVFRGESWNADL